MPTIGEEIDISLEEEDDENIDETIGERLWGLTEMFPETVRNVCGSVSSFVSNGAKLSYSYGRSALWVVASSATILVIPVIFESERAQQQEQQLQQQRQILLGPNAAVSGAGAGQNLLPGMMPNMMPQMPGH
ncbi:hypothetical protein ScPMuIL_004325 [Solemya velum]